MPLDLLRVVLVQSFDRTVWTNGEANKSNQLYPPGGALPNGLLPSGPGDNGHVPSKGCRSAVWYAWSQVGVLGSAVHRVSLVQPYQLLSQVFTDDHVMAGSKVIADRRVLETSHWLTQ